MPRHESYYPTKAYVWWDREDEWEPTPLQAAKGPRECLKEIIRTEIMDDGDDPDDGNCVAEIAQALGRMVPWRQVTTEAEPTEGGTP